MWLYVLLAWFASDNIMGYLASPILFYPLVLLGSIAFACWQLGLFPLLGPLVIPVVRSKVNGVLQKTPIPFRL